MWRHEKMDRHVGEAIPEVELQRKSRNDFNGVKGAGTRFDGQVLECVPLDEVPRHVELSVRGESIQSRR